MKQLEVRIKISVLWMATVVADLVQIVLSFMGHGFLEDLMKGKIGPMTVGAAQITVFSFSLLVPLVMAYVVFVIRDGRLNRRANLIMGVIITAMSWADFFARIPGLGAFIITAFFTNLPPTMVILVARQLENG